MKRNRNCRFALYGRTSAGKTSILAALDMARRANPSGFDGKVLPLENAEQPDENSDPWDKNDDRGQLYRGHEAVSKQVQRIKDRDPMQATARSDGLMRVKCEFSTKDSQPVVVQLIDFAGEIADPDELKEGISLAQQLHESLRDRDAFFVVVEAPRSGQESVLTEEVEQLRKAFSALRGKRRGKRKMQIPIILVISKWDRFQPEPDLLNRERDLSQFFEQHPVFERIRDDLSNGTADGLFEVFPVSALGKVSGDGTSSPSCELVDGELQSYGLEDPFVWAVGQVDRLRKRQRFRFAGVLSLAVVFILGTALIFQAWAWNRTYKLAEVQSENPSGGSEDLERWLEDYAKSLWLETGLMRLSYSTEDAKEELRNLNHEKIEKSWRLIEQENDRDKKVTAAQEHIKTYKNSPYAKKCEKIIRDAGIESDRELLGQFEKTLNSRLTQASSTDLNDLLAEHGELASKLNYSNLADNELAKLKDQITNKQRELARKEDRRSFEKTYQMALNERRLLDAADLLKDRYEIEEDARWLDGFASIFKKQFPDVFKELIKERERTKQWEDANKELQKLERNYDLWPPALKDEKIFQFIRQVRSDFDKNHDRYLYRQVKSRQTSTNINRYLKTAPLQTMQREIKELEAWMESMNAENRDYQFELSGIQWSDKCQDNGRNFVKVFLTGDRLKVIDAKNQPSRLGEYIGYDNDPDSQTFKLKQKREEKLRVEIKIVEDDAWYWGWGDDTHGVGVKEFKIHELEKGAELSLTGDYGVHTAYISIKPARPKPPLPDWSDR